jgi:thiosulfate dehydrogenase
MKQQVPIPLLAAGLALVLAALLAACTATPAAPSATAAPPSAAPPSAAPATAGPALAGDPLRGGRLYDKWWEELGAEAPAGDQPLWKTQTTNTLSGADTWRCKECHGWDYRGVDGAYGSGSHKTGFAGLAGLAGSPPAEILAALRGGTNPDHDFSSVLGEQDLADLALFVSQQQLDTTPWVNADKTANGDPARGRLQFEGVCLYCHGPEGNAINFDSIEEPEFVGHVAADNPWEFLHKVRVGQPGWPMPSAIANDWSEQDVADVLAYAQTLPTDPFASGGGPLYDKWWEELGTEAPAGDQPLWKTQTTNTLSGADTWRCKECHGWDYRGVDGAYGSGSHMTGFPGVLGAADLPAEELAAWLTGQKNPDHDFSEWLGEPQVQALVTFIRSETFDSSAYVNPDKSTSGDPARGRAKFDNTCAACHGPDGNVLNFGSADEPEYVGTVAADNPWEFLHKASFGHPGVPMPAGIALGYTLEDRINLLAYAQTLPVK